MEELLKLYGIIAELKETISNLQIVDVQKDKTILELEKEKKKRTS